MNLAQLQHEQTSLVSRGVPVFSGEQDQSARVMAQVAVATDSVLPQPEAKPALPALGHMGRAMVGLSLVWMARRKQRRALMRLDDRLLADVGLSRGDAQEEYRKPFWRA